MDILVIARGSGGSPISKPGEPPATPASPGYDKYLHYVITDTVTDTGTIDGARLHKNYRTKVAKVWQLQKIKLYL